MLITGGTRGIGRAAALRFALGGARVGIVGRDADTARRAAEEIGAATGTRLWSAGADLADLAQVERLASEAGRWARGELDVLVHCAGAIWRERRVGPSGIEMTVAVHVLGPHVLTSRLEDHLRSPGSAVIWVSSGGMYTQPLDIGVLEMPPGGYRGSVAYARAKRAQVALAQVWDTRLRPARSFAMHPGWVDTQALHEGLPGFARLAQRWLRTPAQGADTAVWLGSGEAPTGAPPAFWLDRRARATARWPGPRVRAEDASALWQWCQRRAALEPSEPST